MNKLFVLATCNLNKSMKLNNSCKQVTYHPVIFLLLNELQFLLIFPLTADSIQGTKETERLVLGGLCLSMKDVIKLKFS